MAFKGHACTQTRHWYDLTIVRPCAIISRIILNIPTNLTSTTTNPTTTPPPQVNEMEGVTTERLLQQQEGYEQTIRELRNQVLMCVLLCKLCSVCNRSWFGTLLL